MHILALTIRGLLLLKIEQVQASIILCVALLAATPFFVYFGALSDRIGRTRIINPGSLHGSPARSAALIVTSSDEVKFLTV